MKKIGLLYICTGTYQLFWKAFYQSFEEYFLSTCEIHYFVFTDAEELLDEEKNPRIHKIYQENLGWPGNTLFRFRIFLEHQEVLEEMEYLFFINANTICCKEVTEEEFLPKEGLLFVQHPGYYQKKPYQFPYERNKKSFAYVPYAEGDLYICGGINGGQKDKFITLCKSLRDRIDKDYAKGVIAKWHDESHINRYRLDCKKESYKMLSPSFCYPEGWDMPFEKRFMICDKSKVLDVKQVKNYPKKKRRNILHAIWWHLHMQYLKCRYDR